MGVITVTERQAFKRCRERWDFTSHSRQNLEPVITPTALSLGRIIHEAHAEWIEHPDTDPVEFVMQSAYEELQRMKKRYKARVGTDISDDELSGFYDTLELARIMMGNYRDQWKTPLPENFELVGAEQTVIVPIPDTNCANCEHRPHGPGDAGIGFCYEICSCLEYEPHYLEATFDGIIRGPDGRVFVLERKTYRARPKIEALNTNDQFLAYCWALGQMDIGPVGGVAYDGMWKRDIYTPKGRGKVELKDLFLRTLLTRPQYEIDMFENYLRLEANEMCAPDVPIYLNRRWEGCYDCPMERLCNAKQRGEDVEYIKETFYANRDDTGELQSLYKDDD